MKARAQYAVVGLVILGLAGLVAVRLVFGHGRAQGTHAVLVLDRSDSTRDGCASVVGVAEDLLATGAWPKGSSLVLLGTGDADSLSEPVELFRFSDFRRRRTMEGKAASAREDRELLAELGRACAAGPRTHVSPIYLAIRRGAELLASEQCATDRCTLAVVSDGDETSEPGLVAALKGTRADTSASRLPGAIENQTMRVRFCGLSETEQPAPASTRSKRSKRRRAAPQRDGARAERAAEVWQHLFAVPGQVELSPICPKSRWEDVQ